MMKFTLEICASRINAVSVSKATEVSVFNPTMYGLPSNTQISLAGNGAFYGTIYASEADFTLKAGGKSSIDDFTGASITKTTTMTATFITMKA